MPYKVTFFFEGVQKATIGANSAIGWTETFYLARAGLTSVDAALLDRDVKSYVILRRNSLHSNYRLSFVRVSDVDNPRLFKIATPPAQTGMLSASIPDGPLVAAAQVQCAILVDLVRLPVGVGDITHHRRFLIRGLPQDAIDGNVINATSTGFRAVRKLLSWLAFFESGQPQKQEDLPNNIPVNTGLGIRYHDPSVQPVYIGTLTTAPPGNVTIKVSPNVPGPGAGQPAPQYLIKDMPAPLQATNRVWTRIGSADAGVFAVLGRSRRKLPSDSYAGDGNATITKVAWLYGLFSQYTIIGLRSKKTGRLFRQLRGRSSSRA